MMNVVERVGNLISQGVLAIAIPFHPFGGAIDVIVVQQRDGTFRSTPWHVQFGKFQGVLKGAEKVCITVNGVEADFHMYLDSSGEAYFRREVDPSKGNEGMDVMNDSILDDPRNGDCENSGNQYVLESCILEHGGNDTSVQMRDKPNALYSEKMAESDGEQRFCFHDEQSPLDELVEISDDRSNQYMNIKIIKSHDQKSEVLLGSADGHVQLTPRRNCPGLGDGMDFGEGNEKFDSEKDPRPCNCNNQNASKSDVDFNICSASNDTDDFEYQLEVCEGDDEHVFHSQNQVDFTSGGDQVSTSYMELPERGQLDLEDVTSSLAADNLEAKGIENPPRVDETVEERAVIFIKNELSQPSGFDSLSTCSSPDLPVAGIATEKMINSDNMDQSEPLVYFDSYNTQLKNDQVSEAVDHEDRGLERSLLDVEFECELPKSRAENSNGRIDSLQTTKFEISLCGSKLYSGMGLSAAAEAFDSHHVSAQVFGTSATSITRNENLVIRFRGRYWHWDKVAPVVLGMAAFGMDLPVDPQDSIPVEQDDLATHENEEAENISTPSGNRWSIWSIPFRRVKKFELNGDDTSNEEVFLDTESEFQSPTLTSQHYKNSPRKQISRTNIPTTEQIASLNLKEGQNRIKFTFPTKVLGMQKVDAHIYLWKWNARIVISDVDGTITKSDVLGQFMPLVGMDWTQSGVARLFSAIKENGYQLLFLSARAIVQAYLTRSFLLNLKQDGEALPDGPVIISPDGLFPSLYREVIRRTPHEFKIACLEEIRRLFPSDHNPFYAGFGNRDTDELSYMKMGIPKGKIFIINPKGEVMNSHSNNAKSYKSLLALVNHIFPPASSIEQEDFNQWNYWKMPLPEVD